MSDGRAKARGQDGRALVFSRQVCGFAWTRPRRACSGNARVVDAAGAVGRCTRVACAAIMALVLLGDNTSARSTLGAGSTFRDTHNHRHSYHQAWQIFAPSSPKKASSTSNPARTSSLEPRKASISSMPDDKRRKRVQAGSSSVSVASGSNTVSPAQMYRVRRGHEQEHRAISYDGSAAERDSLLRSPRSASAAGDGREYPERLTVYSSSSSMSSSSSPASSSRTPAIAEGLGAVAVEAARGGELGRPALPVLDEEDLTQLRAGQRVQKQTREGGSGSGSVVIDVRADKDVVMGLLTKYEDYAEMIDTVRQCEVFPQGGSADTRKVEVTVSRFRLHIRVVMSLLKERNMVQFELDPDCTKAGRAVLREATGFFYVESPPDRPGYSRVWMLAKVNVNRFVPGGVVDYAAGRALPRASNWIKPTCEAAQRRKVRAEGSASA